DPRLVLEAARGVDAPRFLFEYTSLRRTLAGVRCALPAAMIGARAHNIEPLQHWDNHGLKAWRSPYRVGAGLIRLAQADWNCKRLANVIYSISDWENRVYWNRLPGRARVEWLPYYCPDHL